MLLYTGTQFCTVLRTLKAIFTSIINKLCNVFILDHCKAFIHSTHYLSLQTCDFNLALPRFNFKCLRQVNWSTREILMFFKTQFEFCETYVHFQLHIFLIINTSKNQMSKTHEFILKCWDFFNTVRWVKLAKMFGVAEIF